MTRFLITLSYIITAALVAAFWYGLCALAGLELNVRLWVAAIAFAASLFTMALVCAPKVGVE